MISADGVDVNGQDEESGWTALHRALYFGHVRLASMLMAAGADGSVGDHRGRRPVDLISRVLARNDMVDWSARGREQKRIEEYRKERSKTDPTGVSESSVIPHGHVFSWGNGSNYTLGTGSLEVELAPARVDTLHMHDVVQVGAAKFHSAAVTIDGKLFTWGWGRGGRLGHPEKNIHSGSSAVIYPRLVRSLLSAGKVVRKVAVAKHHTLLTTANGELFSMGGNRHGQLGHGKETVSAKSVAEPKKVTALRACFIADIAAANKHSVAVTSTGEVYTWGSNTCGQLGYGAFDSTSSPLPRVVDAMKGRSVVMCAAAKRHTVVLTKDGDVLTWGHKGVSPRKVNFSSVRKSAFLDGTPLRFQKGYKDVSKPKIERICAGAAHTSALTTTGVVLTWRSADPHCQVQELGGALAGECVVDISAGKYRTAAVTDLGTVFMWEGRADYNPADCRLAGSSSRKWRSTWDEDHGDGVQTHAGSGIHMLGSSIDSISSMDGSHLGSSPGSFSCRFGSPSMLERMHSRLKSTGLAAHSPSPSCGSMHSFKGTLGAGGTPQQRPSPQAFDPIYPTVVDRLRRITHVAVGEKHSLALQSWVRSSDHYFSAEVVDDESGVEACAYTLGPSSLQVQCEEAIAKHMVDPYTVLQVMMYAQAAGADMLYRRCCCVAALNLDIVITEHPQLFTEMPPDLLLSIEAELERVLGRGHRARSSTCSDDFVFLTPTCDANLRMRRPSRADRELGDAYMHHITERDGRDSFDAGVVSQPTDLSAPSATRAGSPPAWTDHSPKSDAADQSEERLKLERLILKKLEQIHVLEEKERVGAKLDFQQTAKLGQKGVIMSALAALEGGVPYQEVNALLRAASQAVVESQSQQRNHSAVGSDSNAQGREREPRDASCQQRNHLISHSGEKLEEISGKAVPCTSSKPKAKSKRKPKIPGEAGSKPAHPVPSSSAPPEQREADVVTASLRQMRVNDAQSCSASRSTGSPCIVGFTHERSPAVPQHTLSPIKTVGFRPSMDGRPGDSSKAAENAPRCAPGLSSSATASVKDATDPGVTLKSSSAKQQSRKGGLTMFLRGELDSSSPNKPAWGGPNKLETPVSPLSKWFGDSGRTSTPVHPDRVRDRDRDRDCDAPSCSNPGKQTLGKVHSSGPKPKKVSLAAFMGKPEAAWSSEKRSPSSSKPIKSLRTIQDEQEELRAATRRITFAKSPSAYSRVLGSDTVPPSSFLAHSSGQSPRAAGAGFFGTSPHSGGKLFVASSGPSTSRWYISEEQSMQAAKAKSLMDIQEEERAAKEMADITRAFADLEQARPKASSHRPRRSRKKQTKP